MHNTYITLNKQNWLEVIIKVNELPEKDAYMFILRSLANSQQISYFSIAAFNKEFIDDQIHSGQSNNIFISQITRIINKIIDEDLDVGKEFSFRALSTSTTIATSQPTTWSCAKDFIKLACGSGARLLVQDNGIVNVEGSFTVNGAPVTTTLYVQEQLAIKDKLIEKLSARLDSLEKKVK